MLSTTRKYTLVASASTWNRLLEHLAGSEAERMAFGYCSAATGREKTRFILRAIDLPPDAGYAEQHSARVVLGAKDTIRYLLRAKGAAALLDAHSHPFPGAPHPSTVDEVAARGQYSSLQGPVPGAALVRIITSSDENIWAGVQMSPDHLERVHQIQIVGRTRLQVISPVNADVHGRDQLRDMDQRTLACLGPAGLALTRGLTVGVIGVGGVGSMVARLLGGVAGELILIDPDRLEPHNTPRVWYAGAASRGYKVAAAQKALRRAFPDLRVRGRAAAFPSTATARLLEETDFLFVCPDHNAVRYSASQYAAAKMIPLLEVGCGGRATAGALSALGYHVRLQVPGGPCLSCNGLDLSRLEDPETTGARHRLEYIDDGEEVAGELATLTTRAAADAVDIFLRYCTGYAGNPPLHLYGDSLRLKTIDLTGSYTTDEACPRCGTGECWPPAVPAVITAPRRRVTVRERRHLTPSPLLFH